LNFPCTDASSRALQTLSPSYSADGLPVGLQLTGRWLADEDLLSFGQEIARVVASG
jgi:Asp-tRNA(Asn)/Glu-tRNA(Gln) amidotransferase A subunit family amidase